MAYMRMTGVVLVVITLILVAIAATGRMALGSFGLGPLFNHQDGIDGDENKTEILGPFITHRKIDKEEDLALRPFFYWSKDFEKEKTHLDILYPLASYSTDRSEKKFQAFFHLIEYEEQWLEGERPTRELTLFPFLFLKKGNETHPGHFAFFPFYGKLRNKFLKDEIDFILFPLYWRSMSDGVETKSFLWPFLAFYGDNGDEGFRIWPLFGHRERKNGSEEKFALWPFFAKKTKIFHGDRIESFSVLPLYSTLKTPSRDFTTVLWPFFNHVANKDKGYQRWDLPWPVLHFTSPLDGERYDEADMKSEKRLFPLFSSKRYKSDREGFFLWPLYSYSLRNYPDHVKKRKSFLYFVYTDTTDTFYRGEETQRRRVNLWPLMSYSREVDGSRKFHFLSVLEPFFPGHKGIENNLSPFWRLFTWRESKDGVRRASFLWNIYTYKQTEDRMEIKLQPILPIFSYSKKEDHKRVSFIGGFIGYEKTESEFRIDRKLKLFYIPFKLPSRDLNEKRTSDNT